MKYAAEREFITNAIQSVYNECSMGGIHTIQAKTEYDLVTDLDLNIERTLSRAIKDRYPADNIHGEEMSGGQKVEGRTWTIDPIDGTCNMANGLKLYGVQCALFDDNEIVMSVIYLPNFQEIMYAEKGCGCFLNGHQVKVKSSVSSQKAIISFGDYPHTESPRIAMRQHGAIRSLYPCISKIRMFGAACMDFYAVASGKTDATVVITTNLWDIAPGILMCKEAGAHITNLNGKPFEFGDDGVIASAAPMITELIAKSFDGVYKLSSDVKSKEYKLCIFDFDGVVIDTERYHLAAWNESCADFGIKITDQEYWFLRSTGQEHIIDFISQKLGRELSEDERQGIKIKRKETFAHLSKNLSDKDFIKGVCSFLELLALHNVPVAVASSSRATIDLIHKFNLMAYFDMVVDGNIEMPRKPAPDIYEYVCKKFKVDPEECLVFEDSIAGIEAAKSAGMDVVAVGGCHCSKAIKEISSFRELL